jgi:hypothetical protein
MKISVVRPSNTIALIKKAEADFSLIYALEKALGR